MYPISFSRNHDFLLLLFKTLIKKEKKEKHSALLQMQIITHKCFLVFENKPGPSLSLCQTLQSNDKHGYTMYHIPGIAFTGPFSQGCNTNCSEESNRYSVYM